MLVRVCPVCGTERDQQELFCGWRNDAGELCYADLSREPFVARGSRESRPAPMPAEPRWVCANGHDAAAGDYLCTVCGADVRRLDANETPPGQPIPPGGVGEPPQSPLGPLEPLQTCIGDWVIAGVDLDANFSGGPHPCRHQDGRLGELHFDDLGLIEALTAACPERMCAILDRGDWHGRRFAVLEVVSSSNEPATDTDAIRVLVEQIGPALDRLHRTGFRLRTLSPDHIRCRPTTPPAFVLSVVRDAVRSDDVADRDFPLNLNPFHVAPEVLAGSITPQSDWWSLGTIILYYATEGACFAGIHPSVWRVHVVTSDVPLPETLPPSIGLLLRGLLTRDLERRWQWPEVKAWLDGEPISPPHPQPEPVDRGSAIMLGGAPYRSFARYAIAAASDAHWDEARGRFESGELLAWCLENNAEEQCLAGLRRVATASIDIDLKSAIALKCVYPDLPLVRRGEIINPAWLIHNATEGYDLITGTAADLLDRLGFEPELVRLRDRASVIRRRLDSSQIAVDEPELRARLLVTNIRKLELEWERRRAAFPESEHRGLARLMRRFKLTEDDLIILNSAALTQFKPASEIIEEANKAARKLGVVFDAGTATELLRAKPYYDILKQVEARIADFARCRIEHVDNWADSFRSNHQLPLFQCLIILALPPTQWKKPEGLEYSARILKFFEDKIALSIKRGPLARMTVTATSQRIDLMEFNSALSPAERLLEAVLERAAAPPIDPTILRDVPGLEYRFTKLVRHVAQYKRDTGIDCLTLGFPFILYKPQSAETKPRIAPLFLWPVKASGGSCLTHDLDRTVTLNPALDGFMTHAEITQARAVVEDIKDGASLISILDDCERILKVDGRALARLPHADVIVESNKIVPAAVLFAAVYPGQSLINDLRSLQARPVTGTALATLFRLDTPPASVSAMSSAGNVSEAEKFFVAEIDPSQEAAIMQSRTGKGLLIEGPPGTGKSQTIVNLIADAIGRGKSLLFVCQKQAALDVVFNRLKAAQLEDRIFLIKDESRDRRPTVQALRAQAAYLQASESPRRLARQRAELAAGIDRLEAEIDVGHHAFFSVHESIDRSYADVLTELIAIEDKVGPLPQVRGLRALVSRWSPLTVAAVSEQCAALASDWLPSSYEDNPLAVLKRFDADGALCDEFFEDFAKFLDAEERRVEMQAARNVPFHVTDAAEARRWISHHRNALEQADGEILHDFSRWIGAQDDEAGALARLNALLHQLDKARHQADKLRSARLRLDAKLYSVLRSENEPILDQLRNKVRRLNEPARAWFSLRRYLAQRTVTRYLHQALDASIAPNFVAFEEALETALSEIVLRKQVTAIAAELDEPPPSDNGEALGNVASALSLRLAAVVAIYERLAACPNTREACKAASTGERSALLSFLDQIAHAASLAEARDVSLDAVEALRTWFEPAWIADMTAKLTARRSTTDDTAPLKAALPTLRAFQRFRTRAVNALPESLAVLQKLRGAEKALRDIAAAALGQSIDGIINREARLAWKSMLEELHPDLLRDRDSQATKVDQLGRLLNNIRSKNREYLQKGIDKNRTRFDEPWQRIVLLQGPNALGLRQIVERGIELGLMTMRPVWLMNPDVASRALPLTAGLFDIVVFDEASQIPVENALPALFRGKQVIVSGDEKQLPPTSFFASGAEGGETEADATLDDDATEEERLAAEQIWISNEIKDAPDLLHLARSSLPDSARVMLKVHYRSEWKELIAFSNAAFYGGALSVPVVRPDALVRREQPISVQRVDGIYGSQTNTDEASAVVETVAAIWRASRDEASRRPTTGVVTFNLKQADLIADIMAERRRRDADFAADFEIEANRAEDGADQSFFVKNLENVQGDERDIVIFSTTFGIDANGTFRRNFGVLGQSGGERRLNVATTRARRKMIIATSMPVHKISDCLAKRKRPETPRDFLQLYLHYAELVSSGQLPAARALLNLMPEALRSGHGDEHSVFTDLVGAFLEARGIRAVSLRDGSAFAMDFAVEDPSSGNFCLGIECDAPRHPLLAAARARELWRPQTLGKMMPAIHRISLRDWLANREQEQERLLKAVDLALLHRTFDESVAS